MTRATSGKSSSIGPHPAWTKRRPRDSVIGARLETATAMKQTTLKQIPSSQFFARLGRDSLFEGFVRYLAVRIADQQQVIANLVTVDSEQRLGKTLLQLARTMGKKDPRSIRIELKISHEELSEMVGTTRPRISLFMQRFHNLGLIETNKDAPFHHQRKETHRLPRSDRLERLNYLKPRRPATVAWGLSVVQ